MKSSLELYRGTPYLRESVWQRMMLKGDLEKGTGDWEEAYSVAKETMAIARRNLEVILEFLRQERYVFLGVVPHDDGAPGEPWLHPDPNTSKLIRRLLEEMVGPLPLSVRAWWEVVGAVSLRGRFEFEEEQELPMNDPLVVEPLEWLVEQVEEQLDDPELTDEERFSLDLSPDLYHKADVSGGAPYQVRLPDHRADTSLRNVRILLPMPAGASRPYHEVETSETFVQYLRRSFEWGGFPGYAFLPNPRMERLRPLFGRLEAI